MRMQRCDGRGTGMPHEVISPTLRASNMAASRSSFVLPALRCSATSHCRDPSGCFVRSDAPRGRALRLYWAAAICKMPATFASC